jgi:tRNA pseudouridine38-40 synthase
VARLKAGKMVDDIDLMHALNDDLPPDINVLKVERVNNDFDPRRDATSRQYLYQISTRRTAFAKRLVWWVKDGLDVESMARASSLIRGRGDFRPFCEMREDERSTIVDVMNTSIEIEGEMILFRIAATHFLWKMVRRLVGTLVEVGRGHISEEDFRSLLAGREVRSRGVVYSIASHTAPPSGLFLERVDYAHRPEQRSSRPVTFQRKQPRRNR